MTEMIGIAGQARIAPVMVARLQALGLPVLGLASADAESTQAFARDVTTLIIVTDDIGESEALLFEDQALIKRAPHLSRVILCATLTPRYVRALRHRIPERIAILDAPAVGNERLAAQGQIAFLVGATEEAFASARPLLLALGRSAERLGGLGAGTGAKVLRDCLAATSAAMTRLALDWAEAQRIDEPRLLQMLDTTPARTMLSVGGEVAEPALDCPSTDENVIHLVREVEGALDAALADAHLTPPGALRDAFRNLRARALH